MDRIDYIMIGYICFQVSVDLIRSIRTLPTLPYSWYRPWERVSDTWQVRIICNGFVPFLEFRIYPVRETRECPARSILISVRETRECPWSLCQVHYNTYRFTILSGNTGSLSWVCLGANIYVCWTPYRRQDVPLLLPGRAREQHEPGGGQRGRQAQR